MASQQRYTCKYCGRNDLKSSHGYTKHLQTSSCNQAWLEDFQEVQEGEQPSGLGEHDLLNLPPPPQKPEADFRDVHDLEQDDFDQVAAGIGGALDDEEGMEALESESEDD